MYCSLGDIDCIEAREETLFDDYLEQLEKQNDSKKEVEDEILTCEYPELEYINKETNSCEMLQIYFGSINNMLNIKYNHR